MKSQAVRPAIFALQGKTTYKRRCRKTDRQIRRGNRQVSGGEKEDKTEQAGRCEKGTVRLADTKKGARQSGLADVKKGARQSRLSKSGRRKK